MSQSLGVRFDINKVESADYGGVCWRVFWRTVDIHKLAGARLFEGDTRATINGQENAYCIAVQPTDPAILSEIRSALEHSVEFQAVAALPKFVDNPRDVGEPLVDAGQVDLTGSLVGNAFNARPALTVVQNEKR